mmetsp:Transcript_80272/g.139343  ORF Transcript_80272/g.139343 Transcript_80272/m.139343 type:complete len:111 (-) Transcript_80272:1415-1747(-)
MRAAAGRYSCWLPELEMGCRGSPSVRRAPRRELQRPPLAPPAQLGQRPERCFREFGLCEQISGQVPVATFFSGRLPARSSLFVKRYSSRQDEPEAALVVARLAAHYPSPS